MFCLAGPAGNEARSLLKGSAKLVWTCEAESYFEAMTKYYDHQGWGDYTSDFEELDRRPYVNEQGGTESSIPQ